MFDFFSPIVHTLWRILALSFRCSGRYIPAYACAVGASHNSRRLVQGRTGEHSLRQPSATGHACPVRCDFLPKIRRIDLVFSSVADAGCLSRIPDPDFYPSRIPHSNKKGGGEIYYPTFFLLPQISQNCKLFYFWTGTKEKVLSQFTTNYITTLLTQKLFLSSQKYGFGIWDLRSGIRKPEKIEKNPQLCWVMWAYCGIRCSAHCTVHSHLAQFHYLLNILSTLHFT